MRYERILAILATIVCLGFIGFKLSSMSFESSDKTLPITGAFSFVVQNPLISGGGIIIALIIGSILWVLKGDSEFLREEGHSAPISKGVANIKEIGSSEKAEESADIKEEKEKPEKEKEEKGSQTLQKEEKERKVAPKKEKEEKDNIGAHEETGSGANTKSPRQAFYNRQEDIRKKNPEKEN